MRGQPLIALVAERLLNTAPADIVAVVAAGDRSVANALAHLPISIVSNPAPKRGMGSSISCGVAALASAIDGILIQPGDMPCITTELLKALIAEFEAHAGERIVHPVTADGSQRNPVIWPALSREELTALDGQQGGKSLLARHTSHISTIEVAGEDILTDIDTQEDLARLQNPA